MGLQQAGCGGQVPDGIRGGNWELAGYVDGVVDQVSHALGLVVNFIAMVGEVGLDYLAEVGRKVGYFFGLAEPQGVHENAHKNLAIALGWDCDSTLVEPAGRPEDNPFEETRAVFGERHSMALIEFALEEIEQGAQQLLGRGLARS